MIKRLLPIVILFAGLCTTAVADDAATISREEISAGAARKERIVPVAAQGAAGAQRATIDLGSAALPKPEQVTPITVPEPSEPKEAPIAEVQAVKVSAPQEAPKTGPVVVSSQPAPKKGPPVTKVIFPWFGRSKSQAVEESASAPAVIVTTSRADVSTAQPVRKRTPPVTMLKFPQVGPPKEELTSEEELHKKIEGKRFKGETGFTTVTSYKNKDIRITAEGTKDIVIQPVRHVLSLKDCIRIAEENHIQALVAKKSIKLAELRLFEARRNLLPSATIVVERSKGRVSDKDYLGRKQYIEGQQPIYHGGELYYTMKQAEVNLQIAKNDHNRVKNDLVLQVKKAYYTLEKAKENSILQEALTKEVDRMYNVASKGYEAGATAKVEYFNVSSQASQVKYQLASAKGDVSVAELILKQAMNVNMKDVFDIAPSTEFERVTVDFEKIVQDAYVNRPEVKANSLMVTYYDYGRKISKAKTMPKVDLLGQWGLAWEDYVSSDFSASPGQDYPRRDLDQQWYAGIKASMPFWGNTVEYSHTREQWVPVVQTYKGTEATTNSFKFKILDKLDTYSDQQLADIDYDRSRSELNKIKNDITLEVREGCFNYEKALIQYETATNKVKYQEADAEIMKLKRGMDEVQDSNVIDSLIKVAQEKFGLVQAITDCKTSLATLEKAVGVEDYFKKR